MTPKSKLFQAGFSAVLAVALIVTASPARAEPVTLSCRYESSGAVFTLRIDYATGLVEGLAPSGKAYTNERATATISPNAIVWDTEFMDDGVDPPMLARWEGTIDRLSGTGSIGFSRQRYGNHITSGDRTAITCRQATKPKF